MPMLLPFLAAVVLIGAPPASGPEQARLTALFAKPVPTSVTTSAQTRPEPTRGTARQWRGGYCSSGVQISLPGLPPVDYDISWTQGVGVRHRPGEREVTLWGAAPPTRVPVIAILTFRFADAKAAKTAADAMTRLMTTCVARP